MEHNTQKLIWALLYVNLFVLQRKVHPLLSYLKFTFNIKGFPCNSGMKKHHPVRNC